jgi:3-phenylpropionate/cinnamic acid dioxygenase small subunit
VASALATTKENPMTPTRNVEHLADKLAIREVLEEYCLRLEVNPFEEWLDLFTQDSIYEVYRHTLRGRQEISEMLSKAPHGVHLGGPLRIELDGDSAATVQNYVFYGQDDKYSNKGWYYRTLVRTGEGWKISHTRVEFQKTAS